MIQQNIETDIILNMDCREGLRLLPDNSIDCCITSPPYFGLRDYGIPNQIGMEPTPDQYIDNLTAIFAEVLRVLKPTGTLWLNMGDTYNSYKGNARRKNQETEWAHFRHQATREAGHGLEYKSAKPKDLIGIPWMLAFSLRNIGWYLRQDIIWSKPNPMPESVSDRCTKAHEYIFLLSKEEKYYYDAKSIREKAVSSNKAHKVHHHKMMNGSYMQKYCDYTITGSEYRNRRDVWTVAVQPSDGNHFATYPEELIRPCVVAGCPEDGIILDPFVGTGTTAVVAHQYNRRYIGYEINKEYFDFACMRIKAEKRQLKLWT